jgi:hypothetical protein
MTLSEISAAVYATLLREAGTQEFWNETDIKTDINYLYRDTAKSLLCCTKRDVSTSTVIGTARYVIPLVGSVSSILKLFGVTYDGKPIDFITTEILDSMDWNWRSAGNSTPLGCYYEKGDEYVAISLYQPPSDVKVLGFEFSFLPTVLTDALTPVTPFIDGTALHDGVVSMELSKPGGGRDLDRADFWFGMFMAHIQGLSRHKGYDIKCFKSIEESSPQIRIGGRLPSNYPINND